MKYPAGRAALGFSERLLSSGFFSILAFLILELVDQAENLCLSNLHVLSVIKVPTPASTSSSNIADHARRWDGGQTRPFIR